eukprot:gene25809-biopygen8869
MNSCYEEGVCDRDRAGIEAADPRFAFLEFIVDPETHANADTNTNTHGDKLGAGTCWRNGMLTVCIVMNWYTDD